MLIQKFHVSHGGWHGEFGPIMPFVVVDGCKMLHNSSFDSMSHFVQDKFQSTNSEDKFKHIQYMSKNTHTHTRKKTKKTYPQHILQTHRTHINIFKNPPCHFLHRMVGAGVPITYHSVENGSLKWGRALVICGFYLVLSFLFWRHDHLWAQRQTILEQTKSHFVEVFKGMIWWF